MLHDKNHKYSYFLLLAFIVISLVTACNPVEPRDTQLEVETKKVIASGTPIIDFELTAIELPFFRGYTEEMKSISMLDDKVRSFNWVVDYIYLIDEERLLFIYERNTVITATLFHWKTGEWQSLEFSQPISVGGLYTVSQISTTTYGFSVKEPEKQDEFYLLKIDELLSESGPYVLPGEGLFATKQFCLSPNLDVAAFVDTDGSFIRLNNWSFGLSNEIDHYSLDDLGLTSNAEIQQVHFLSDETLFFNWRNWSETKTAGYGVINLESRKPETRKSLSGENRYWHGLGYSLQENLENRIMITDSEVSEIKTDKLIRDLSLSRWGILEPLQGNLYPPPMDPSLSESIKEIMPATFNMLLRDFENDDKPTSLLILPRESITYSNSQTRPDDRNLFSGVQDLENGRIFSLGAEKMYEEKMVLYVIDIK